MRVFSSLSVLKTRSFFWSGCFARSFCTCGALFCFWNQIFFYYTIAKIRRAHLLCVLKRHHTYGVNTFVCSYSLNPNPSHSLVLSSLLDWQPYLLCGFPGFRDSSRETRSRSAQTFRTSNNIFPNLDPDETSSSVLFSGSHRGQSKFVEVRKLSAFALSPLPPPLLPFLLLFFFFFFFFAYNPSVMRMRLRHQRQR